jgi:hypothetical protein
MLLFLPRRRFVTETVCPGDVLLQETFCNGDVLLRTVDVLYGDVLSRRRFVRRRFVCAPVILMQRVFSDTVVKFLKHFISFAILCIAKELWKQTLAAPFMFFADKALKIIRQRQKFL